MSYDYADFRHALALRESSGDYTLVNTLGFLGAYQFGEGALIDLGFVNDDGKWWDNDFSGGWTGKDGIHGRAAFLASPDAQDHAANLWFPLLWGYLEAVGAEAHVGEKIDGIRISPSGLIAGAHLLGAGAVRDWLASGGSLDLTDAYGTPIAEYIGMFSGYSLRFDTGFADLGDLIGPSRDLPRGLRDRLDAVFHQTHDVIAGTNGGSDDLQGDRRADILAGGGHGDTITAGGGGDVALGGGGADRISGGQGDDWLDGDNGADRLAGNGGDDRLDGGPGDDRLAGGTGRDRLAGGTGDDTLTGGRGGDLFVFRAGGGNDRITDFDPAGQDRIRLTADTGITSFHALIHAHVHRAHGDVVIDLAAGDNLTLEGVHLAQLSADDFLF